MTNDRDPMPTPPDPEPSSAIDDFLASTQTHVRRESLAAMLGLLDLTDADDPASDDQRMGRIDAVAARCLAADSDAAAALIGDRRPGDPALTPASADALDAALAGASPNAESGSTPQASAEGTPNAQRVAALLGLLDTPRPQHSARQDLVARTVAHIERHVDAERQRLRIAPPTIHERSTARRRPRLADFVAFAALIVLGVSVFSTVSDRLAGEASLRQNESNLSQAGFGIGLWANDHDGTLPALVERSVAPEWWSVGDKFNSHSANLFTLADRGYTRLSALASPSNRFAPTTLTDDFDGDWRTSPEVSYSYQLFLSPPRVSDPRLRILLGDRSPIAQHAAEGIRVNPMANSRAHDGAGQHLLAKDQTVHFVDSPLISRGDGSADNIWLPGRDPRAVPSARSIRRPTAPFADVFLAP